jgi:Glycosyltransferase 61
VIDEIPRECLTISGPREQIVFRSRLGACLRDGTASADTRLAPIESLIERRQLTETPPVEDPVWTVDDEVVWGGNVFAEYDHFAMSSVSRLWPLLPGGELEGLPAVFTRPSYRPFGAVPRRPELSEEWLAAFGAVEPDLPEKGAVRFTNMFVPEPASVTGAWVCTAVRDIHLHARRGLKVPTTARRDIRWLSRSRLGYDRRPYDEALLEWLLGDMIAPVHPETMTLAELVGMLESSRAIAGVAGSELFTLLLTADSPACLYFTAGIDFGASVARQLLGGEVTLAPTVRGTMRTRRARERGRLFPADHRVLVPEALRAFGGSVLPGLLDDPRLAAFAGLGDDGAGRRFENELDEMVKRVMQDPYSFSDRLKLGRAFDERCLDDCATEQYTAVAELSEDPRQVAAATARLTHFE